MQFKTKNLQQAAALLSQEKFKVTYSHLEPTQRENKFEFVLEVEAEAPDFHTWQMDYMNKRTKIEPKTYDSNLGLLRDNLSLQRSRKGAN